MITSVYQLSALVPKKQKAITDSIFDDLLVMAMAKSFVRNVLEIVWLVGEGRMAENKRGGNKKVWNREEQVWGGVESMQQRGPTSRCVVHFGFVCSVLWCGTLWFHLLSCVVWMCGTLWFRLNEAPTGQKMKSSVSLFQNPFVKAWSQRGKKVDYIYLLFDVLTIPTQTIQAYIYYLSMISTREKWKLNNFQTYCFAISWSNDMKRYKSASHSYV